MKQRPAVVVYINTNSSRYTCYRALQTSRTSTT